MNELLTLEIPSDLANVVTILEEYFETAEDKDQYRFKYTDFDAQKNTVSIDYDVTWKGVNAGKELLLDLTLMSGKVIDYTYDYVDGQMKREIYKTRYFVVNVNRPVYE